jgi:trimeric autotransporter adhesin
MKTHMDIRLSFASVLLASLLSSTTAAPLGTAFTYQGRLNDGTNPANGNYDLTFTLYGTVANGSAVAGPLTNTVAVSNGLFAVALDFGAGVFTGEARWLEMGVRPNSAVGDFTILQPRQPVMPTPYALHAASAAGLLSLVNAPLDLTVNGQRALRLEPASSGANVIGGSSNNFASAGVSGATIGGGGGQWATNQVKADFGTVSGGAGNSSGWYATVGGGSHNTSSGEIATVSGGIGNISSAYAATVGGGSGNTSSGEYAAVGGGEGNSSSNFYATVGGGSHNLSSGVCATVGGGQRNSSSSNYATVGGGVGNTSSGYRATVGGGHSNTSSSDLATVGGGYGNTSSGECATVGGGSGNSSSNSCATVPGGFENTAGGNRSFAAGNRAQALHDGAFVWGDSTDACVASTDANSWTVRASGGVRFFSDTNATVGAYLPPGGNGFNPMSDRNVKENFKPVDPRGVLEKVSRLPVTEWTLISQPGSIRHIGPMAQDFQAAFGVGEDDRHISTSDADGVALAAIQGLNQLVKEKDARIERLEKDVAELKAMVNSLVKNDSPPPMPANR